MSLCLRGRSARYLKEAHRLETLYATFNDAGLAENAVRALLDHGGSNKDISIISREPWSSHVNIICLERDTHRSVDGSISQDRLAKEHSDHAKRSGSAQSSSISGDTNGGAVKGARIGLGVGIAAAITSLIIPGLGLVMGGGALATALAGTAGAAAAGAIAGGVTGYFRDQGVSHVAASDYQEAYENGSVVLCVHIPSGNLGEGAIRDILSAYKAASMHAFVDSAD